ncbi:MAG: helicase C-terminal domain-containing protein [Bacilli bacterium]|nr:helicase C-terminal domain-containing protein [Bacillales bacterium]MDY2575014.1 helicase C-terminal domain-containing protein [Bacilli bacterium]
MNKKIIISVHGLVDFLLRSGDIDNRIYNSSSMLEGTRIHLRYQQIQSGNYLSEQFLETSLEVDGYDFNISGRADGIIVNGNNVIIDEIKSTVAELEYFYSSQKEWHLGQAKVYAYMYSKMHNLERCGVRLTYISQQDNDDKLIINFSYTFKELEEFIISLCRRYLSFYISIEKHNEAKRLSSANLAFPFEVYRPGQKELAKYVYGAIFNKEEVFIEAPTGIGKTMSTLFPSVKSFATLDVEKIFYLCAKNVAKNVAFEASKKLIEAGLIARVIKLQSKDHLCRCDARKCNPDECPFTKGYYDKLKRVIEDILKSETQIDENLINDIADKEMMCPFELQLDISLYCDIIICDYNYIFDPMAYLKRYFDQEKTPYVALVDEAHNLVDRSRDMYSASIDNETLKHLRFEFKKFKVAKFKKALKKVILYLDEQKEKKLEYVEENINFDEKFYSLLSSLNTQALSILRNNPECTTNLFLDFFRKLTRFLKISEFINSSFHIYFECKDEVTCFIRCIDPSKLIKESVSKLRAAIFFSATLTPIDYYISCLGGDENTPKIILESPFDKRNLLTIVRNDISTKYKDRDQSYQDIADTIFSVCKRKVGNYLIFFSSYQYMEKVYECMCKDPKMLLIKQTREMEEEEKEKFLNQFKENPLKTTIGMAVLGGAFSEGIDLVSSRLIGAIIIGLGLPTVSYERDKMKSYFESIEKNGFDFAYVYPGMNKIMQAAGRVIRSEKDVGLVVFIDDRFTFYKYKNLLKEQYKNAYYLQDIKQIERVVDSFWNNHKF